MHSARSARADHVELAELDVTTLSTPAGSSTCSKIAPSASIDNGVCLAGLTTVVQPAASAILRAPIVSGKFHGVTSTHGPTGCRVVSSRPLPFSATV